MTLSLLCYQMRAGRIRTAIGWMRCQSERGAGLCCWQWWMSGAPTLSSESPPSLSVSSTAVLLHRGRQIQRDSNKNPIFPTRGGRGESRRRSISSAGGGGRQCYIEHTPQPHPSALATEIDNMLPEEKMTIKEIPFKGRQSAAIITSTAPSAWERNDRDIKNHYNYKMMLFHRNLMTIFNFFSSGLQAGVFNEHVE